MCGEMAGDPAYTLVLLGLGLEELSMTAGQISPVKSIVRRCQPRGREGARSQQAMQMTTGEEIERFVRSEMERRFGERQLPEAPS